MENIDQNPANLNTPPLQPPVENKKMAAGLCALLIGTFGIHKFILGYTTEGIIYIVTFFVLMFLTIITCGIGGFLFIPFGAIPLIEGIIYLTKTDEEFYEIYQKNKKPWF
jgi:TM2 domain-containing membrane protein YozV